MSDLYLWLKWAHIVSSTVLFGTGAGIAFFFIRAQRTGDVRVIAAVGAGGGRWPMRFSRPAPSYCCR